MASTTQLEGYIRKLKEASPELEVSLHKRIPSLKSMKNDDVELDLQRSEFSYPGYKRHVVSLEDILIGGVADPKTGKAMKGEIGFKIDFTLQFETYRLATPLNLTCIAIWMKGWCVYVLNVNQEFVVRTGVTPTVSELQFDVNAPIILSLLKKSQKNS